MTIGRAKGNRIVVPDPDVSERHAIVERSKADVVIKVLDSASGVLVNGETSFVSRVLYPGDWFQIGKARMTLHADGLPSSVGESANPCSGAAQCAVSSPDFPLVSIG